jgi:hypothetical protein
MCVLVMLLCLTGDISAKRRPRKRLPKPSIEEDIFDQELIKKILNLVYGRRNNRKVTGEATDGDGLGEEAVIVDLNATTTTSTTTKRVEKINKNLNRELNVVQNRIWFPDRDLDNPENPFSPLHVGNAGITTTTSTTSTTSTTTEASSPTSSTRKSRNFDKENNLVQNRIWFPDADLDDPENPFSPLYRGKRKLALPADTTKDPYDMEEISPVKELKALQPPVSRFHQVLDKACAGYESRLKCSEALLKYLKSK